MGAEAVSRISTYFRVCDGVRVRFADNRADSDITILLLAPWPESLWAFRRIWNRVAAVGRVVAIDLPGFGHSDGRPDLIAPDGSGAFLARLIDEWGLGAPHVVGPDVGTAAALFLAAKAPERVTSLTVGGGAVRFPIDAGGALKEIIEAPTLDDVRALDARTNIGYAVEPAAERARSAVLRSHWRTDAPAAAQQSIQRRPRWAVQSPPARLAASATRAVSSGLLATGNETYVPRPPPVGRP